MIKAIGLDWDGTLIDFLGVKIRNSGIAFADEFGMESINPLEVKEAYRQYSGVSRKKLFDQIAQVCMGRHLSEQEFQRLSSEFDRLNDTALIGDKLFPYVFPTLEDQKRRNRILYVSSSVPSESLNRAVERIGGLRNYFNHILGGDIYGGKGSGHTALITKSYDLTPSQIVYVCDEPIDIDLAREAGTRIIAVTNTYEAKKLRERGADQVIPDLSELEDAIERL